MSRLISLATAALTLAACTNPTAPRSSDQAAEAAKAKDKSKMVDTVKLNSEREAKITANQKKKEVVGQAYGATAAAYKAANPPAAK